MALLTFRENIRSKAALSLLALVALASGLLPFALDGGPGSGAPRMTLLYPLGVSFGILAFAAPWMAAAAISGGVKRRTLQLARVKPIRAWQLWLGKWLGVMSILAAILAVAFAIVCGHLARMGAAADDGVGSAKELFGPVLPPLEEQVSQIVRNVKATAALTAAEERALRATLRRRIPNSTMPISGAAAFEFLPARMPEPGERFWLRLKFISDRPAVAECALSGEGAGEQLSTTIDSFPPQGTDVEMRFGNPPSAGALRLDIRDASPEGAPDILIQPRCGIYLMLRAGTLWANMVRAYLVLLSSLAILAALGMAFGALFSLPVAVFAATCAIFAAICSNWVVSDESLLDVDPSELKTVTARIQYGISAGVTRTAAFIARPALSAKPLTRLSASEWIPSDDLALSVLVNCLGIPFALCAFSSYLLARRELPE